jgi:hypothetical protein
MPAVQIRHTKVLQKGHVNTKSLRKQESAVKEGDGLHAWTASASTRISSSLLTSQATFYPRLYYTLIHSKSVAIKECHPRTRR